MGHTVAPNLFTIKPDQLAGTPWIYDAYEAAVIAEQAKWQAEDAAIWRDQAERIMGRGSSAFRQERDRAIRARMWADQCAAVRDSVELATSQDDLSQVPEEVATARAAVLSAIGWETLQLSWVRDGRVEFSGRADGYFTSGTGRIGRRFGVPSSPVLPRLHGRVFVGNVAYDLADGSLPFLQARAAMAVWDRLR